MKLTDSTEVRQTDDGNIEVVGDGPTYFLRDYDEHVFTCGWLVRKVWPSDAHDEWYPDSEADLIGECGAPAVGFDNGWACVAGHSHRSDVEYFVPGQARSRDGQEGTRLTEEL